MPRPRIIKLAIFANKKLEESHKLTKAEARVAFQQARQLMEYLRSEYKICVCMGKPGLHYHDWSK